MTQRRHIASGGAFEKMGLRTSKLTYKYFARKNHFTINFYLWNTGLITEFSKTVTRFLFAPLELVLNCVYSRIIKCVTFFEKGDTASLFKKNNLTAILG